MVRVPASYVRAGFARLGGSGAQTTVALRRVDTSPDHLYVNRVTVDLGNDGIAPLATFNASGVAAAFVGPNSSGELWSFDQCYLATSIGQFDAAVCTVYVGPLPQPVTSPVAQYAATGSVSGGSSQFGMGGLAIEFGWFALAVWTGGTSGATATLRVTGTKTVLTN